MNNSNQRRTRRPDDAPVTQSSSEGEPIVPQVTGRPITPSSFANLSSNRSNVLDEAVLPPPETTRPTPSPASRWNVTTVTNQHVGTPKLRDIMHEQRQQETELSLEDLRVVELAQEEEMIQLALQKSLTDFKNSSHSRNSNRSLAERDTKTQNNLSSSDLFALKVRADAERTETFIESPHGTTTTISSSSNTPRRAMARFDSLSGHSNHSHSNDSSSGGGGGPDSDRNTPSGFSSQGSSRRGSSRRVVRVAASTTLSAGQVAQLEGMLTGAKLQRRRSSSAQRLTSSVQRRLSLTNNTGTMTEEENRFRIQRARSNEDSGPPTLCRALSGEFVSRAELEQILAGKNAAALALQGQFAPSQPLELPRSHSPGPNIPPHIRTTAATPTASPRTPSRRSPLSGSTVSPFNSVSSPMSATYNLSGAEAHLSAEELQLIEQALLEAEKSEEGVEPNDGNCIATTASDASAHLSKDETVAIEKALRDADAEEEAQSIQLALKIQQEEATQQQQNVSMARHRTQQGNVRTMTRAQLIAEQNAPQVGAFAASIPAPRHPMEEAEELATQAGFRMNSAARQAWTRRDQNCIVGPNNEMRTKHDLELDGLANAHRLGLETDATAQVGNRAYNSFMQSVKSQSKKGVAAHGTGRAGSDADGTKGGAMDPVVRMQISRAINSGLIEKCNGVVKEGKEAIIYHAEKGTESQGFDVAVKVFKRIQEFKGRGNYVTGDPRYVRASFKNAGSRGQIEMWAEKEFRNLVRANRAGVPVATPLLQKENVLFMRFLGTEGWPAPQLREVGLRVGSSRWETLYAQVLNAVQRLFNDGKLVHADLSEYNIMVVPAGLVENGNAIDGDQDDLQAVLIDFGQAVDVGHPDAEAFLRRDLDRVLSFFRRQGIDTVTVDEAVSSICSNDKSTKRKGL